MFWAFVVLISSIKLLLTPSYRSTDFEVHRNWLAITHSKHFKNWYFENTSEWTLDYPPLFAWFEYFLSHIALHIDPEMLKVDNLHYASTRTILFQRCSVIATDAVYFYGVYLCMKMLGKGKRSEVLLPILMLANPGLLMIDHIHFQYNGVMYGLLLISICKIMQKSELEGAFWFSVLLNMKHIYLYVAPAYFVHLFTTYCLKSGEKSEKHSKTTKLANGNTCARELSGIPINFRNFFKLGALVISIFLVTYLPFVDHIDQVISRLFPFKRGLCHSYWAPNFWALYNVADKAITLIASKMGVKVTTLQASMTGGLVREFSHATLPNVSPKMSTCLVGLSMLPALIKLVKSTHKTNNFLRTIVLCALSSFMFGWHVHEKAILMAIIPLSILAVVETGDAKAFLLLSTFGHYSFFPLLFPNELLLIKLTLVVVYAAYAFYSLFNLHLFQFCQFTLPLLNSLESVYVLGLLPLFSYCEVFHHFIPSLKHYEFLPLMLTSVYCAVGVMYTFIKYYLYYLIKCK